MHKLQIIFEVILLYRIVFFSIDNLFDLGVEYKNDLSLVLSYYIIIDDK